MNPGPARFPRRTLSTAVPVVLTLGLLLLSACYPGGPESLDEIGTVITHRNPAANQSGLRTYAMEDTVAELVDPSASNPKPLDRRFDPAILDEIQVQMEGAGFRRVDPDQERPDAWVAVGAVRSTVWVYWRTWGYWGGYWNDAYRPPYFPTVDAANFDQGTVIWQLLDLRGIPEPIPEDPRPVVNWIAAINGAVQEASTTETQIRRGIIQAFEQSPYIQAAPAAPAR